MPSDRIGKLLESVTDGVLEYSSIAWGGGGGVQDAEMALLIDEGSDRSLFLEVLHSVLIRGITEVGKSVNGHEVIEGDLLRWFKRVPDHGALVFWLKVALERYPMRLFVACDWIDHENLWPGEEAFWFDLEEGKKAVSIEESTRAVNGIWRTPDPRPWKGASWRRFFGKRICWLAKSDIVDVFGSLIDNNRLFVAKHFINISVESVKEPLELFPLWLRLRWVDHLARQVRGLDWSYRSVNADWPSYGVLRTVLDLVSHDPSNSYRPSTLPPINADAEFGGAEIYHSGLGHIDTLLPCLVRVEFPEPYDRMLGVELHWARGDVRVANAIMKIHQELFEEDNDGSWNCTGFAGMEVSPWVLFAGALSGSLVSHNSLAALSHDSWSQGAAWRLLEVAEHSLLRVAICDERVQEWWERGGVAATNAIQRRVFSLFWERPGAWNQGEVPAHGFSGRLGKHEGLWKIELCGPSGKDSLFQKSFRDDPWPAAADVLLIHQGILDKWGKENGPDIAPSTEELMALKDEIPWLIVTSGRGKPDRVSAGVRFLPLSGLQACLVGNNFDKLLLVRQLAACGGEV